jgi:hypothetical protein
VIIDVHTHIFHPEFIRDRERLYGHCPYFRTLYAQPEQRMATAEELLESMSGAGIDRAVAFGFPWKDAGRLRATNDYVFEAAERSDGSIIPFAVVDPADPDMVEEEVLRLRGRHIGGIGELMPDGQGFSLEDERTMEGVMRLAAFHNLVVMVHTSEPVGHDYPGKGSVKPEVVCQLAGRFPGVKMICAHWGGGLIAYEMMPEVAEGLKNVYYDCAASSLLYDDRIYRVAAEIVPEKILFGTDYPLLGQARLLRRARENLNDSPHLDAFLGGNATHLFDEVRSPRIIE